MVNPTHSPYLTRLLVIIFLVYAQSVYPHNPRLQLSATGVQEVLEILADEEALVIQEYRIGGFRWTPNV
jgi:hypothetical protein